MKKTGTEFKHCKEIAAILDTAINEEGERIFKVAWKDTWLNVQELRNCERQFEQFLSHFVSPTNKKRKTSSNYYGDGDERDVSKRTVDNFPPQPKPGCKLYYKSARQQGSKRKQPVFNLENIVSKLKETKKKEYNFFKESFDNKEQIGHVFEIQQSDNKHEELFPNNRRVLFRGDSKSDVKGSPEMLDNDKENFSDGESEEKSSFLTELEEKDREMNFNNIDMISGEKVGKSPSDEKSETPMTFHMSEKDVGIQLKHLIAEREHIENYNENGSIDKISETKCEKCNKKFYRRSQLIRHLSNHVVHECQKCNAIFYCVRKYKRHVVQHESYPCDFCEEEFYDASAWYKHRARHTMVECSSCQTAFYSHSALVKHRVHHMQYVCPLCNATFSGLNYWLSHRIYHGKGFDNILLSPIIKCRECYGGFSSQEEFGKHVCLYGKKLSGKTKRKHLTKLEISDLIGVDETVRTL